MEPRLPDTFGELKYVYRGHAHPKVTASAFARFLRGERPELFSSWDFSRSFVKKIARGMPRDRAFEEVDEEMSKRILKTLDRLGSARFGARHMEDTMIGTPDSKKQGLAMSASYTDSAFWYASNAQHNRTRTDKPSFPAIVLKLNSAASRVVPHAKFAGGRASPVTTEAYVLSHIPVTIVEGAYLRFALGEDPYGNFRGTEDANWYYVQVARRDAEGIPEIVDISKGKRMPRERIARVHIGDGRPNVKLETIARSYPELMPFINGLLSRSR
jgi:hypothetical protein